MDLMVMTSADEFLAGNSWAMLAIVFLAPFVQEDAAVIGAATASVSGHGDPVWLFMATLLGLSLSDVWKYWLGRFAQSSRWAAKYMADPRVVAARGKVLNRTIFALMAARFVPGTRIPLYIACGVFKVPFWRFLIIIIGSGALYLGLAFAAFASLGMMAAEQVRSAAPVVIFIVIAGVIATQWIKKTVLKHRTDPRSQQS